MLFIFSLFTHGNVNQGFNILWMKKRRNIMLTKKRLIVLALIVIIAFMLGRLAVSAMLNMLLGGKMF